MKNKPKEPEKKERLKPISLYPLEVEEALGDIMQIQPLKKDQNIQDKKK